MFSNKYEAISYKFEIRKLNKAEQTMIKNTASFESIELRFLFGENSVKNLPDDFRSAGVSTDSRVIEDGNIFVAIRGERIDSHDMTEEALQKGAGAAIVEESWYKKNYDEISKLPLIVVEDSIKALGMLANMHRRRFKELKIIAVGGSNGKTSTKDMAAHLLSRKYNVLKTYSNYNNLIGTPLMMFCIEPEHEIAVIEIGTNQPGEIPALCAIVEPTHGLITNIAEEHLEQLIDITGVEVEEAYLFGHLMKYNGTAFVNIADDRLAKYEQLLEKKITYGNSEKAFLHGDFKLNDKMQPKIKLDYEGNEIAAQMQTVGYGSGLNAVAAAAVAVFFNLTEDDIKEGLETYLPDDSGDYGRMLIEKTENITLINDTYNSNPASLKMAMNALKNRKSGSKKHAVLADMLELGELSAEMHIGAVGSAVDSADHIYFTGGEFKKAIEKIRKYDGNYYENKERLLEALLANISEGDIILVKGSRGMKMEEIVSALKKKFS